MTEVALAAEALQYLPMVVTGVEKLWSWIEGVRSANQQSAEWTPEIEAKFQAALLARVNSPEQQPDKAPGVNDGDVRTAQ
jgi:hypothetical protein